MSNAAIKEIEINCYPYNCLSIQIILIAGVGNRSIRGDIFVRLRVQNLVGCKTLIKIYVQNIQKNEKNIIMQALMKIRISTYLTH